MAKLKKKTPSQELLEEIEAFLKRTGMLASTFGHAVANDGKLVQRLRTTGRRTTLDTAVAIRTYMRDWKPTPRKLIRDDDDADADLSMAS